MKKMTEIPTAFSDISLLFVALGDKQRQQILLSFEPNEKMNILQIVAASALSRTAVSHHLRVLKESGALHSEKVGKEVFFWVNKAGILEALGHVMDYIESEI